MLFYLFPCSLCHHQSKHWSNFGNNETPDGYLKMGLFPKTRGYQEKKLILLDRVVKSDDFFANHFPTKIVCFPEDWENICTYNEYLCHFDLLLKWAVVLNTEYHRVVTYNEGWTVYGFYYCLLDTKNKTKVNSVMTWFI